VLMTASRRRDREQRPLIDWREEAPHNPEDRIKWLRAEAAALLNTALDMEANLPFPPSHQPCFTCEECRMEIIADARRYDRE
jgi:hypothetical protein